MSDFSPGSDRADALLGLALQNDSPPGACPDAEDIAAWHDRRLGHRRQQEVKSHVARCENCYGIWSELLDVDEFVATQNVAAATSRKAPGRGWRAWLVPARVGFAAAAIAATLSGIVFVPQLIRSTQLDVQMDKALAAWHDAGPHADPAERWTWGGGLATRSTGPAPGDLGWQAEAATQAFRSGVGAGVEQTAPRTMFWNSVRADLDTRAYDCAVASDIRRCREINTLGFTAGRWAVLLHFACANQAGTRLDGFWDKQSIVFHSLSSKIDQSLPGTQMRRFFADWNAEAVGAPTRTALCAREASFLTLGLGGSAGM